MFARSPSVASSVASAFGRPKEESRLKKAWHPAFDSDEEDEVPQVPRESEEQELWGSAAASVAPSRNTSARAFPAAPNTPLSSASSRGFGPRSPQNMVKGLVASPRPQKSNPELRATRVDSIYDGFEMVTPAPADFLSPRLAPGSPAYAASSSAGSPRSNDNIFDISESNSSLSPRFAPRRTHQPNNASFSSQSDVLFTPLSAQSKVNTPSSSAHSRTHQPQQLSISSQQSRSPLPTTHSPSNFQPPVHQQSPSPVTPRSDFIVPDPSIAAKRQTTATTATGTSVTSTGMGLSSPGFLTFEPPFQPVSSPAPSSMFNLEPDMPATRRSESNARPSTLASSFNLDAYMDPPRRSEIHARPSLTTSMYNSEPRRSESHTRPTFTASTYNPEPEVPPRRSESHSRPAIPAPIVPPSVPPIPPSSVPLLSSSSYSQAPFTASTVRVQPTPATSPPGSAPSVVRSGTATSLGFPPRTVSKGTTGPPSRSGSFTSVVVADISPNASREDPTVWKPQQLKQKSSKSNFKGHHEKSPSLSSSIASINFVSAAPTSVTADFARDVRPAPAPPQKEAGHGWKPSISGPQIPLQAKPKKSGILSRVFSVFKAKEKFKKGIKPPSDHPNTLEIKAASRMRPDSGHMPMQSPEKQPLQMQRRNASISSYATPQSRSDSHLPLAVGVTHDPTQPISAHITAVTRQLQAELRSTHGGFHDSRDLRSVEAVIAHLDKFNLQVGEACWHICDELWNGVTGSVEAAQRAREQQSSMIREVEKDVRTRLNRILVDRIFKPFSVGLAIEDDRKLRSAHLDLSDQYEQSVSARWRVLACTTTAVRSHELQPVLFRMALALTPALLPDLQTFSPLANSEQSKTVLGRITQILQPLLQHGLELANILHQQMVTAEFEVILGSPLGQTIDYQREEEERDPVAGGIVACHWSLGLQLWRGRGGGGGRHTLVHARVITIPRG